MNFGYLLLISIGLALDAFAVSICKGLVMQGPRRKYGFFIAITFGIFQAVMTFMGWALGNLFYAYLNAYGDFISCGLLLFVGIKMIYESRKGEDEEQRYVFKPSELLILGLATSIDAFAIRYNFCVFRNEYLLFSICHRTNYIYYFCIWGISWH
jgi:putative Mn2+ efflux pump MntP